MECLTSKLVKAEKVKSGEKESNPRTFPGEVKAGRYDQLALPLAKLPAPSSQLPASSSEI